MKQAHLHIIYLCNMLIVSGLIAVSCSSIVKPTGGPRDTEPPQTLKMFPANKSVNFAGNTLFIEFDEYITYNSSGVLSVSPPVNTQPKVVVKGKKLFVQFEEGLQANTTYAVNFGDRIKDYNEGNVAKGLLQVFSTGPYLDSISLAGKLINSYDLQAIESSAILVFKEGEDVSSGEVSPTYTAFAEANGSFTLNYMKPGNYQLVGLVDKNFNQLFDQDNEYVGFSDEALSITSNINLEKPLLLFSEQKAPAAIGVVNDHPGLAQIAFNQAIEKINIDAEHYDEKDLFYFNETNDTLFHWYNKPAAETAYWFTLEEQFKDTITKTLKDPRLLDLKLKTRKNIDRPENLPWSVYANSPISEVRKELFSLKDSLGNQLEFTLAFINEELKVASDFKEGARYNLKIDSGAITNYQGKLNSAQAFNSDFTKTETPSSLTVRFERNNPKIVIELFNHKGGLLGKEYLENKDFVIFENLSPGKYDVRAYIDFNNNAKWDAGNLKERVQAEQTIHFTKDLEIAPNWEKEILITY